MPAADSSGAARRARALANMALCLGVIDIPYAFGKPIKAFRFSRTKASKASAMTTGRVAKILEARYGLFSVFYKARQNEIDAAITGSIQVAIQSLLSGQHVDTFEGGMGKIESLFRDFISTGEAEKAGINAAGLIGLARYQVPTMAALRGISHRLAHPYSKSNPRRPSFMDTGLMQASFKAWISRD